MIRQNIAELKSKTAIKELIRIINLRDKQGKPKKYSPLNLVIKTLSNDFNKRSDAIDIYNTLVNEKARYDNETKQYYEVAENKILKYLKSFDKGNSCSKEYEKLKEELKKGTLSQEEQKQLDRILKDIEDNFLNLYLVGVDGFGAETLTEFKSNVNYDIGRLKKFIKNNYLYSFEDEIKDLKLCTRKIRKEL